MSRPNKRSIAMKQSWRRRKKYATRRRAVDEVPPTAELDDLRVTAERAVQLIQDGIIQCNEGWDLINSIPKRVK